MSTKKSPLVTIVLLSLFFSATALSADVLAEQPPVTSVPAPAPAKNLLDFEQVIATAKKRVFPALVFVKPIREEFGSGEKKTC